MKKVNLVNINEIDITEIEGVKIGHAQNYDAATGCTVFLCEDGAPAGLDVRGGGPASRESNLLDPLMNADVIHAVLLSGGSAFGLDAAGGVMKYLEEKGIGVDTGFAKVPLVCQSCIFDLGVGAVDIRPDKDMAYEACKNAEVGNYQDGNHGAGTGATVGKILGMKQAMKAGIGSYAVQIGELKIGAVAVVNALGDVYDWRTGEAIAGVTDEEGNNILSTEDIFINMSRIQMNNHTGNTTLGVVLTNAKFSKADLCKIAGMAHDGMARAIRPVHTSFDGDSIYALSLGNIMANRDAVGVIGARVMEEAIVKAVKNSEGGYGLPGYQDLNK